MAPDSCLASLITVFHFHKCLSSPTTLSSSITTALWKWASLQPPKSLCFCYYKHWFVQGFKGPKQSVVNGSTLIWSLDEQQLKISTNSWGISIFLYILQICALAPPDFHGFSLFITSIAIDSHWFQSSFSSYLSFKALDATFAFCVFPMQLSLAW